MIDVKQAVKLARINSTELLGLDGSLGIARSLDHLPAMTRLSANPLQYKVFLIDPKNGS